MLNTIKRNSIFLLFALFAFVSCKKDKITHVTGVVVDATRSLSGIDNAKVYLQAIKADFTCFSCLAQTVATYNADASGRFSFSFVGDEGYSYSVVGSAQNYYSNIGTGDYTSLDKEQKNMIEVELKPVAWLKLHVKNTSPFDAADEIDVDNTFVSGGNGGPLYGNAIDTVISGSVSGNSNVNIVWFVTKNGIQTTYSSTLFCSRFDTTSYTINY